MRISKELDDDLELAAKEVESWPTWKRSVDIRDLKKLASPSENQEVPTDLTTGARETPAARAAKA
jgi:hypothetical protein